MYTARRQAANHKIARRDADLGVRCLSNPGGERMRYRRIMAWAATAALITIGVQVFTTSPAAAAALCTSTRGSTGYYIQSVQTGGGVEGVYSHLITRPTGTWCTGDFGQNNFSVAWNMVFEQSDLGDYSQAGTSNDITTQCPQAWAEQSLNGSFTDVFQTGCLPNGSSHLYQNVAVIVGGSYKMEATYDGGLIMETSYNPFTTWTGGGAGLIDEYIGEAFHNETDIPGTPTSKSNQNSMGYQRLDNDLLIGVGNNATLAALSHDSEKRYSHDNPTISSIETWTK
jgi:hypothetical protein